MFVLLSKNPIKPTLIVSNSGYHKALYIFFLCAIKWATLVHQVACSLITMNTHAVVHFDYCPKYSLEQQINQTN